VIAERGKIWWTHLGPPEDSAPAGRRPVLVVQSDAFNQSRIATVVVAVVTSNDSLATGPGNVMVRSDDAGLPRDSVVNVSQLLTLNESRLVDRVGRLPFPVMQQVNEGIRLVLSL